MHIPPGHPLLVQSENNKTVLLRLLLSMVLQGLQFSSKNCPTAGVSPGLSHMVIAELVSASPLYFKNNLLR